MPSANFLQTNPGYLHISTMYLQFHRAVHIPVNITSFINERGLILDGATLLLTTVQRQIAESTSTVRRIDVEVKLYKFVVAVPLRNFTDFSCFPSVNVMLKAWLTYEEGVHHRSIGSPVHEYNPPHKKFSHVFDETHRCLYTEWLGRICIGQNGLIRQFVPRGLSHAIWKDLSLKYTQDTLAGICYCVRMWPAPPAQYQNEKIVFDLLGLQHSKLPCIYLITSCVFISQNVQFCIKLDFFWCSWRKPTFYLQT